MPRKRRAAASHHAQQAKDARWRYLIRNPTFRSELRDMARAQADGSLSEVFDPFLKRWGLNYIRGELLAWLPHIKREKELQMLEDCADLVASWPLRAREMDDESKLMLEIDLRYPRDILESLIADELRDAMGNEAKRRARLDKIDFYLAVYDRSVKKETFREISYALGMPLSTVKTAYWTAARHIHGERNAPGKSIVPMAAFDWSTFVFEDHARECKQCNNAKGADEFCAPVLTFLNQDNVEGLRRVKRSRGRYGVSPNREIC